MWTNAAARTLFVVRTVARLMEIVSTHVTLGHHPFQFMVEIAKYDNLDINMSEALQ